ncbi:MAG: hypothetical protein ACRELD_09585, partial [Longimicrobiales bacterium]
RAPAPRRRLRRYAAVPLAVLVVGLTAWFIARRGGPCGDGSLPPCGVPADVAERTFVVLPFRASVADATLDGGSAARMLSRALLAWDDVETVDPMRVNDLLQRDESAAGSASVGRGVQAALTLGAGRLIMGEVQPLGDSVLVTASMYDARRSGRQVNTASVMLPA